MGIADHSDAFGKPAIRRSPFRNLRRKHAYNPTSYTAGPTTTDEAKQARRGSRMRQLLAIVRRMEQAGKA